MLTTLFESRKKRKRSKAGLTASVVIHGALIAAAIGASTHAATTALEKPKAENIEYVAPPPPKPPEEKKVYVAPKEAPKPAVKKAAPKPPAPRMRAPTPPAPKPVAAAPAAPANVPVLSVPVAVPTTIPGPDLNAIPTVSDVVARASDVAGTGTPAASGAGDGKGKTTESSGGDVSVSRGDGSAWGEEQVDVAVRQQGAANLRYPERLRAANVTGTVYMRFVVGANGRVEMGTVEVVDSPHEEFTAAVKDALRSMRFRPAEVRGTKVRQLVEQPFTFKLNK